MKTHRLILVGFGNVGQGLAQLLLDRSAALAADFGCAFQIVGVCTRSRGSVYASAGLDAAVLLEAVQSGTSLSTLAGDATGWSVEETIANAEADILVETSYTNLETGEPATGYIRQALQKGWHVSTANKGPVALHFAELAAIAKQNNVLLQAEGSVMSGTPALALGLEQMKAAGVTQVRGILNGTTNYILTQMEDGMSYADALAKAQELGYAEADPAGDVEGHDAAGKVVILANMLLNAGIGPADVDTNGITNISSADIAAAAAAGERWKLIGSLETTADGLKAAVQPMRISLSHPLASVMGATNAITYTTEVMGDVTLIGAGAGRIETGYSVLLDLLAIHRLA